MFRIDDVVGSKFIEIYKYYFGNVLLTFQTSLQHRYTIPKPLQHCLLAGPFQSPGQRIRNMQAVFEI